MDRDIVFAGQIPLDVNILQPQKNAMIGIGALAQAVIGPQAASPQFAIDGLACSPMTPASLALNIGPGSVYAQGVIDQSAFGSIPADLTETTVLQGILLDSVPLTFVPPVTAGNAVNYLIQVAISITDNTPVVLPYVNPSNPTVPWLGPNNSGTSQNTVRQCTVSLVAKAGVSSSAGTQATPAPDAGYFGLYVVTVANGATALTSTNFSVYPNAPFIPTTLMAVPQNVQSGKWTFAQDTGSANALVATLSPAPAGITKGLRVCVLKTASPNSGTATLNLNDGGAFPIARMGGAPLSGGEMPGLSMIDFAFDGAVWQLQTVTPGQAGGPLFDGDATGTNVYSVSNLTPSAAGLTNRMMVKVSFANPNTSDSTLNVGFGAAPIVFSNGNPLSGGEITGQHIVSYNQPTGVWELLTPTVTAFVPPTPYVHNGSDTSIVANAMTVNMTPAITSYAVGHIYIVDNVAITNTGGMTANFNSVGTRVVARADGTSLQNGEIIAGQSLMLLDNGIQLQVINSVLRTGAGPGNVITLTSNGTYTPSARCTSVTVTGWGGGGGGATATSGFIGTSWAAGGGGGYCQGEYTVTPGVGIPCIVAPQAGADTNGSLTSFGSFFTASGGSKAVGVTGGSGGAAVGGNINFPGQVGNPGFVGSTHDVFSGIGGASFGISSSTVVTANTPGLGGHGGNPGAFLGGGPVSTAGGPGGPGLLIIQEQLS